MRKLLIPALAAGILVFATALPGLADTSLPTIPAHHHYIVTPDGTRVEVGPRLCDNPTDPTLQDAFNQFHANVHRDVPGSQGPGPAAGLHNHQGANITGTRDC